MDLTLRSLSIKVFEFEFLSLSLVCGIVVFICVYNVARSGC